ncbi:MAG: uroporphyrinogen-III synthase [Nitrososphaerales archaeon]
MQSSALQISSKRANTPQTKILSGRTFLVTRTSEGNTTERRRLERFGAKVIELPTISIYPPSSWKKSDSAISRLEEFDWIVLTSANGVKMFFNRVKKIDPKMFERLRETEADKNPRFACVGPSTKRALTALGFRCRLQPKEYTTLRLGRELAAKINVKGKKILLARAEVANRQITRTLRASGAKVTEISVYRTITRSKTLQPKFLETITDITLTSPSTVEGLLKSVRATNVMSRKILIHCIGPITAKRAKNRGLKIENVAKIHTVDGLVDAIVS